MYKDLDDNIVRIRYSVSVTVGVTVHQLTELDIKNVQPEHKIDAEADFVFYPYNIPILYPLLQKHGLTLEATKPDLLVMQKWLRDNLQYGDYKFTDYLGLSQQETFGIDNTELGEVHYPGFLLFKRESDLLAFRLRWGIHV
jgi:hypothetical protein